MYMKYRFNKYSPCIYREMAGMCIAYCCSAMEFPKSVIGNVSGKIPDNWLCYHVLGFCLAFFLVN